MWFRSGTIPPCPARCSRSTKTRSSRNERFARRYNGRVTSLAPPNAFVASEAREPRYPASVTLQSVSGPVEASVIVPGSKSITNRALLIAALAEGDTLLRSPLFSDDTFYMITALRALGVRIDEQAGGDLLIKGVGGRLQEPKDTLFIGNSGTSVRFLTAACVHLPEDASCVLDGVERMRQRPIQDLTDALSPLGGVAQALNGTGCPPVQVRGGGLAGGETTVRGDISSQYLSALMMTAPLAHRDVAIDVAGKLVSRPYVRMTAAVMEAFGVGAILHADDSISIAAPQSYRACEYTVEPDASNATYFLAAAAVTGGEVTVRGLGSESIQGDVHFAQMLEAAGCVAKYAEGGITIQGPNLLRGVTVDLTLMPDTAQTLAVVCLFAQGPSTIRGLKTLRVKETDRISAIADELRKLGAEVEAGEDYWIINPPASGAPRLAPGEMIATYDDHRMAMAFAVAGLRVDGLVINDPGCVAKTFPDFWERWNAAFYHDSSGDTDA